LNAGAKVLRELIVTCGDATKVLEFIEEALDEIALAIGDGVLRLALDGITGTISRWARVSRIGIVRRAVAPSDKAAENKIEHGS
jgi:hypothetical protein